MHAITVAQIEDVIENPADGQVGKILDFNWLVPQVDGEWWSSDGDPQFPIYYVFTGPERMGPLRQENQRGQDFAKTPWPLTTPDGWQRVPPMRYQPTLERCELVPVQGHDLFTRLAATGSYHSVQINSGCGTWDEPNRNGALLLACGGTRALAQGLDPRPGTRILPARSIAEIHLYMRHFHGAFELSHQLEYRGEELVAVYQGRNDYGKVRCQSFLPVAPLPHPADFGPGVSPILCGGLMAHHLGRNLWDLRNNFHPAQRQALHERTPEILREIDEVGKMLDPQTDRIGPEYFRFAHAPGFLKCKRELIEGTWLRETRTLFERFLDGGPDFRA